MGEETAVDRSQPAGSVGANLTLSVVTPPGATPAGLTAARRLVLARRVRLLVAFTIAYNVIEAAVALLAGSVAGSSALVGFGLDSVIEVSSAVAVAWQFAGGDHEARERVALRVIACSFFALGAFVAFDALSGLVEGHAAHHSIIGIVLAAVSLIVMPGASWIQRRTGHELGSHSAVADSKQTLLCSYMSAALLIGLIANSLLGWWWADPAAAVAIAALAISEGINAWRGDACCASAGAVFGDHHDEAGEEAGHTCGAGCAGDCDCC